MRILLTTDTVGGVWTFTQELTQQLLFKGHSVALVSFGRNPSETQNQWFSLISTAFPWTFRYECSELPLEWMQNNQNIFPSGAAVIHAIATRFQPDIIHSSQFCWGSLRLGVPIVITAHSDVISWAITVKPDTLQDSFWLRHYRNLVQSGLSSADAVVAPTAWMRDVLQTYFEIPSCCRVIYNGRTLQHTVGDVPRELRAVSAGRLWDEAKGLHTLLDIASPIPIAIAGEERFADASALPMPNLAMLGPLSEKELLRVFSTSSIYLITSFYEPFGLAPLEAALCGCAIVSRDLPSLREVWDDGALYFTDINGLETLLSKLAVNPSQLLEAQLASIARARLFTADRMTTRYLELYETVTAFASGSTPHQRERTPDAA